MWQTKYSSVVPKNLGLGVDFRQCSEGNCLSGCPLSMYVKMHSTCCVTVGVVSTYAKKTIYFHHENWIHNFAVHYCELFIGKIRLHNHFLGSMKC